MGGGGGGGLALDLRTASSSYGNATGMSLQMPHMEEGAPGGEGPEEHLGDRCGGSIAFNSSLHDLISYLCHLSIVIWLNGTYLNQIEKCEL